MTFFFSHDFFPNDWLVVTNQNVYKCVDDVVNPTFEWLQLVVNKNSYKYG